MFHIANRWQSILSCTSPVHQELFLLIFAREHNRAHSCDDAVRKYKAAQAAGPQRCPPPMEQQAGSSRDGGCDCADAAPKRRKKKVQAPSDCLDGGSAKPDEASEDGAIPLVPPPPAPFGLARSQAPRYVVLNARRNTVHTVVHSTDVFTTCSWSFQGTAQVTTLETLSGKGFFTCGTCFGWREPV